MIPTGRSTPVTPAIQAKMIVKVTQYMRPDGRKRPMTMKLDASLLPLYEEMLAAGFRFSVEVLGNGVVSVCIENDEYDADCALSPNGPEIVEKMEAMLRNKAWTKPPEPDDA